MHDYTGNLVVSGLIIGNPFTSPVIQRLNTYSVAASLGILDSYNMD